ncbi:MAG TPA: protein kinase [Candidatus Limnocylindrales bacterium]|nr:protein kinase [Candidatus Limnocylindrales bacterium]
MPPSAPGGICPECMLKAGLATQTEGPGGTGPQGTKVVHPPPSPAEIAALFPQLEILECLGRGGMGVVYKARQPRLNRFVALKILAREKEQDARFAERFTREAQALARLNHPNIVTVHDFGEAGGHCYLVMEFVDGLNLRQLLQARKMPSDQALTIVPKICEALQYAHEQGVVHRDIKPENILLDKSGRVKIADFGIAKMLGDESGQQTLTGAKDAVGTPHYMAPEQIEKPLSVDHRADIYSLGVVFYEMLTGELPLGRFAPPSKKVHIDVRLDEVVLHALEKEPERRYQQASQVKTAVETIAATSPGGSPSNLNAPVQTAAEIEAVRKRLKIPARGLIASTVLQLLFALGLLIFAVPGVARESGGLVGIAVIGFIVIGFLIPTAVVLTGVTNMLKLRRYTFTVVASVVAAVAGPGAILGLPFGIWACVELFRPEVRSAFAANRSATRPTARPDSGKMDFARAQVKGPAVGLVVTGVLDWVLMTAFCVFISFSIALESPGSMFVWLPLLAMALSGCIIYAGLKFMQLERRGWVMFGSVLAMLVSPGNLIGLPLGIWALVTLNRREVREAFAANHQPADKTIPSVPPAAQSPDHFWRFIVIGFVVMAVLGLLGNLALRNFFKARNVPQVICKTIQTEVGRQLHQAGATYDSLQVTVAEQRDSGTPFTVSYKGLRHFKYTHDGQPDPNWPASADGQFIMQYIGGSQWQGALGDTQFTVQAGTVDNINLPFIDDPPVIGEWQSVDFVAQPSDFNPDQPQWKRALFLKGLTFLANGRMQQGWLTWTKGVVMHHGDKTASRYEIREINGTLYMFFEWKSGDSMILGRKPPYYVLKKISSAALTPTTGSIKSDYIGQTWFPSGDLIEITSVERNQNQLTVKGHYNLVSHDNAELALYITVANENVSEGKGEIRPISKGHGDFALVYLPVVPGLPHVSMYADGHPFASLYFGTQAEALEESKAGWITNAAAASTLQFRLVLPPNSTAPADDLPSPSWPYRFRLSRQVLLDDTDIARAGVDFGLLGGPMRERIIEIRFTDSGAKKFEAITTTNIGRQLGIVFREQVLSAPVIQSVIPGGECQVTGLTNAGEVNEIVDYLNRTAPPTTETWRFSPLYERILPLKPSPDAWYGLLDLDSGMIITNSSVDWVTRAGHDWIRAHGLDVVPAESAKHLPGLLGIDMIIAPAPTNGWDIVTAADVIHNWACQENEPRQMQVLAASPGQTDTFFFQTREGGKGILQILGFAENTSNVKLRYKLVQNSRRNISTASETEQNANQENARQKLQQAERELELVQKKVEVGLAPQVDFEKAKIARDIAEAELNGTAVEVARLKLQAAELDLKTVAQLREIGRATADEYQKAASACDIAAAELAAELANHECEHRYGRRPFVAEQYSTVLQDGTYHWGHLDVGGQGGFSAMVSFQRDAREPHVEVYFSSDVLKPQRMPVQPPHPRQQ